MPTALARTLGVIAAAMVVLTITAPGSANTEITSWIALGALGLLVAIYPSECAGVRTDKPSTGTVSAPSLPPEARGARARTAILGHLADGPDQGYAKIASFIDENMPPSSAGSAHDLAPAYLAQRVRELTDRRAIELAEQLGLDLARRQEPAKAA